MLLNPTPADAEAALRALLLTGGPGIDRLLAEALAKAQVRDSSDGAIPWSSRAELLCP